MSPTRLGHVPGQGEPHLLTGEVESLPARDAVGKLEGDRGTEVDDQPAAHARPGVGVLTGRSGAQAGGGDDRGAAVDREPRNPPAGLGKVSPVHHLDSWLPRAEHELKVYEPVPGITPYTFIGDLTGKAFRIAHMGHVNAPMILGVLGSAEVALTALNIPHGAGGTEAAIRSLGAGVAAA